jgi:COP9 signalosome complex subunit 2
LLETIAERVTDGLCSYDFEYEDDDDAEEGGDVDVENKYYNAKQMKTEAPEEAIEEFLGVPALEEEKGDWGFKGLKQAIKLEFRLGRYEKVSDGGSRTAGGQTLTSNPGCRTLHRALDICQVSSHPQLLRKIHQQHARLH